MKRINEKEFEGLLVEFIKFVRPLTEEERIQLANELHKLRDSMESGAGKEITNNLENFVRYGKCEKPENEGAVKWSRDERSKEKSSMTVK